MLCGLRPPPKLLCRHQLAVSKSSVPCSRRRRDQPAAVLFLLLACISLVYERRDVGLKSLGLGSSMTRHLRGLLWSAVAIVGRPLATALRKEIATPRAGKAVRSAEQVGMTSLIQGLIATRSGFICHLSCMMMDYEAMGVMMAAGHLPHTLPLLFWICLVCSSFLNTIIKTATCRRFALFMYMAAMRAKAETHAYNVGEMSLCAPFLAFDPARWPRDRGEASERLSLSQVIQLLAACTASFIYLESTLALR